MTEELPAFAHNLGKELNELAQASNLLLQDIKNLMDVFRNDWSSQSFRRMFVRSCWVLIEGEVFRVKQLTLRACELGGKSISADEHVFLSEVQMQADENYGVKQKDVHEPTLENLKRTLKIATSKFEVGWNTDFGNQGWQQLRRSLDLRHRITHPRTVAELMIQDDELNEHQNGFAWYLETINNFQSSFDSKYQ